MTRPSGDAFGGHLAVARLLSVVGVHEDLVAAGPAEDLVAPGLPDGTPILRVDHVVAGPAVEPVPALAAVDLVVSPETPQHVVAVPSPELVPAGAADEGGR